MTSNLLFEPGTIYRGDCLDVLQSFPNECVDLIYIDPPFHSGRSYEVFWGDVQEKRSFEDRWGDVNRYLDYMRPRVLELHRVLKRTGSFYYHCDWHAGHYIKVMLDEVFGLENWRGEIIWEKIRVKKAQSSSWPKMHDTILNYSKTDCFTFNLLRQPISEKYVDSHYRSVDPATGRRYRLVSMVQGGQGPPRRFGQVEIEPPKGKHWIWSQERIDNAWSQGLIVITKGGRPNIKRFLEESLTEGSTVGDIWTDIPPVNAQAKERLGYPTQKPVSLAERIITASSNVGDIVLDGFCGCGTSLVAAELLQRKWLGIDVSPTACRVMGERLERDCAMSEYPITGKLAAHKSYYKLANMPMDEASLRLLPPFEFQNWAVLQLGKVLRSPAQVARTFVNDKGIDGKIYLVDSVSLVVKDKETLFGEKTPYLPVQVKQMDKVGRPDIDKFETALKRDGRTSGFFVAFDFTRDSFNEIRRCRENEGLRIYPFKVVDLIREDFQAELIAWRDLGE